MTEKRKLSDIAKIDLSSIDKKSKPLEHPVKLCNFTDIYYNWAITKTKAEKFMVATASANDIKRFALKKGQVAITKDSETRDDIGIAAYIADDVENTVLGYHCALITPDEQIVNGKFLNAYLNSRFGRKYFSNQASGSGQRYTLTENAIGAVQIPLPDISTQNKIGNLFSALDRKIENNFMLLLNLQNLAKLIYDYWFIQFDFPNKGGTPYKKSGGKMIWNGTIKREIPEGWEIRRIGDFITTERGVSYNSLNIKTGTGIPMINLANFKPGEGEYQYEGLKYYHGKYPENKRLKPYDLIMCNTQQTAINYSTDIIGRAMLVPDIFDSDIIASHHINVINVTGNPDIKYYLLCLFNSSYFHKYIAGFTNGTNILGLTFKGVEDFTICIPEQRILHQFAELVFSFEKRKSEILAENAELEQLRDFLLPLLINGQVTFKEEA